VAYPHSSSYQATTLTCVVPTTLVSWESKTALKDEPTMSVETSGSSE